MEHVKFVKEAVNHVYWSLLLQGVAFVILAMLVILYPALLFGLVAATFLIVGIFLIALAWKIRMVWHKVPKILQ